MSGTFIVAARSLGQVNVRSLSTVSQAGLRATSILIRQPQFTARNAAMANQLYKAAFYSTAAPKTPKDEFVKPSPASMEEINQSGPLKAGLTSATAPEAVVATTSTPPPPPPPPVGVVAKAKDFFRKGKEIVIQCKDGVKLLWVNKKIAKDLKRAQKEDGYQLTRREFQLVHKTHIDLMRLIPFGLIFCLATEYIPLIIIFAPQLIPTTCVTPTQLENLRKKTHEKRSTMTEKLIRLNRREITKESLANYNSFLAISKKYGDAFDYTVIDREHLASFCKFMGVSGFGPKFMLKKRLHKHMTYIAEDDRLLSKDGLDTLSFSELQLANEERGMRSLEVSKEHLEKSLAYWLKLSQNKEASIPPGLMVFSRMFLLHSTFKSDTVKK